MVIIEESGFGSPPDNLDRIELAKKRGIAEDAIIVMKQIVTEEMYKKILDFAVGRIKNADRNDDVLLEYIIGELSLKDTFDPDPSRLANRILEKIKPSLATLK